MKFTLPQLPKVNVSCLQPVIRTIEKRGPDIMIGLGITGLIGAVFMTAKIAPKADRKLKKKEFQKGEELTKTEAAKEVGRDFVPVILLAGVSVASIVLGTKELHKRTAAITALCTLAETSLADYKKQVVEMIGEEKEEEVSKKVDEMRADQIYEHSKVCKTDDVQVIDPYCMVQPFYDIYRGIPFYGKESEIDRVVNYLNKRINEHCQVSLNDFYYELGLDPVSFGDNIGWSEYTNPIEIRYGAFRKDGVARTTINFKYPPDDRF